MAESVDEIESLKVQLADSQIRVIELEKDLEDFIYVNHEMMTLFGVKIADIVNDQVNQRAVFKKIKSNLLEAMTDEEGFSSLFKHFADEAVRIGEKYHDVAEKISADKKSKLQ